MTEPTPLTASTAPERAFFLHWILIDISKTLMRTQLMDFRAWADLSRPLRHLDRLPLSIVLRWAMFGIGNVLMRTQCMDFRAWAVPSRPLRRLGRLRLSTASGQWLMIGGIV